MTNKDLDLGLDPAHSKALREEATKHSCFGGCGLSYEDSNGGWFEFEKVDDQVQLAPRWYCDSCSAARSPEVCYKADTIVEH